VSFQSSCTAVCIGILQELLVDDKNNVSVLACLILLQSPENLSLLDNLEELKQVRSKTTCSVADTAQTKVALYVGVSLQAGIERSSAVVCCNLDGGVTSRI
jgi:hypothetical protein